MKHFLLFSILSALVAFGGGLYLQVKYPKHELFISAKTESETPAQLFFDLGEGFKEKNSVFHSWKRSNQFQKVVFQLPFKTIHKLRLDPFEKTGFVEINEAYIMKDNELINVLDIFSQLVVSRDLIHESTKEDSIIFRSAAMSSDPIIEIVLKEPLSGWSLEALSIQRWSIDTLLIFLAMMLMIWTLTSKTPTFFTGNILFRYGKEKVNLKNGNSYSKKHHNCYRDAPEDTLIDARKRIDDGEKWEKVLSDKFKNKNDWLFQIITSNSRSKFLKDRMPSPNDLILDIGAGWGQFSIPLAKSNKVCSLEPTPERLNIIKSIAQQEKVTDNMYFIGTDYLDIEFQTKFDLILCIGVLEWIGSFREEQTPGKIQSVFLKKSRSELSDKGKLVIGIENRLGLKYIMGARDDHHGFQDVMIYGEEFAERFFGEDFVDARRCIVHSLPEYKAMLRSAGFQNIKFYVAIPDYKLVEEIFPITESGSSYNEFLNNGKWINEHDGIDGSPLANQEKLQHLYKSLAKMNIAHYFAPSFFIEAY